MMDKHDFERMIERRNALVFAIMVHGAGIVYERPAQYREVVKRDAWGAKQARRALLDAGMDPAEVDDLMTRGHRAECACWRCILWLQRDIKRANAARGMNSLV